MKKFLSTILLSTFLFGCSTRAITIDKGDSFMKYHHTGVEKVVRTEAVSLNPSKVVDHIKITYDLNGNGKEDTVAFYRIGKMKDYAKKVYFDEDEDGRWDYVLIDTTNDGNLDQKGSYSDL